MILALLARASNQTLGLVSGGSPVVVVSSGTKPGSMVVGGAPGQGCGGGGPASASSHQGSPAAAARVRTTAGVLSLPVTVAARELGAVTLAAHEALCMDPPFPAESRGAVSTSATGNGILGSQSRVAGSGEQSRATGVRGEASTVERGWPAARRQVNFA